MPEFITYERLILVGAFLAHAQKPGRAKHNKHLELHLEWWRGYYYFVRPHDPFNVKVDGKSRKRMPAMALGLTDKIWSVNDILV